MLSHYDAVTLRNGQEIQRTASVVAAMIWQRGEAIMVAAATSER